MRVGIGYDVHRLVEGRPLILGGVHLPYPRGLLGHSDGDALIHAIIDALLGAAGLGDIGAHFPPGDPQYKDIRSTALLERVEGLLRSLGWKVVNVDATIVAEHPALQPHIQSMRRELAQGLGVEIDRISVKAKSNGGLGFLGASEGIAAWAVALLQEPG
jgi:2-C-methyl-D-erythritol 2,4-cyclodiphosphate synthase